MTIILPALAVAFAAFCVWLAVRVYNRRERWAKWTLAAVLGVPLLYVTSFGPACWLSDWETLSESDVCDLYRPIGVVMLEYQDTAMPALEWYGTIGSPSHSRSCAKMVWADAALHRMVESTMPHATWEK
jgi:hypothetical protein